MEITIIDRSTMNTGTQVHRAIACDNQQNKEWVESMLRFYNCKIVEKHRKNQYGYTVGGGREFVVSCYCDTETWHKVIGILRKKIKGYSNYCIVFRGVA